MNCEPWKLPDFVESLPITDVTVMGIRIQLYDVIITCYMGISYYKTCYYFFLMMFAGIESYKPASTLANSGALSAC
jgi:hypothetical protein